MAGATANFGFPYPTATDPIQATDVQKLALNVDAACEGLAGAGTCVQMRQQSGAYQVQGSNRFITDYDSTSTTFSYYAESDSVRLSYNVETGLVLVPVGFTVLAWGSCSCLAYPAAGTFEVGLGSTRAPTAMTPATDYGGSVTPTQPRVNYTFMVPPAIIRATSTSIYVGLYCGSQQRPVLTEYKIGVITLHTGSAIM